MAFFTIKECNQLPLVTTAASTALGQGPVKKTVTSFFFFPTYHADPQQRQNNQPDECGHSAEEEDEGEDRKSVIIPSNLLQAGSTMYISVSPYSFGLLYYVQPSSLHGAPSHRGRDTALAE